jgi:hypothetical protein
LYIAGIVLKNTLKDNMAETPHDEIECVKKALYIVISNAPTSSPSFSYLLESKKL